MWKGTGAWEDFDLLRHEESVTNRYSKEEVAEGQITHIRDDETERRKKI